ncbi:hypothetical protein [Candidatus Magnetomonas plexicatena]|uniref:hypothetical protein n=1 Tax=Candidatus Magnetomonas plexicatena TaxID=2552947 RepID=UPI001C784791|nr:hypothetical protein E2O03_002400 [Nitrospirales bacterium LBB_01]
MLVGYGILAGETVKVSSPGIVQISVFKEWDGNISGAVNTSTYLKSLGIPAVFHPVGYFLSETREEVRRQNMDALLYLAKHSTQPMIVHDETTPWSTPLVGQYEEAYEEALKKITEHCPVSIENASNTLDVTRFWHRFASSITLDIGHVQAAGIDSETFVEELDSDLCSKVEFIHVHRANGPHYNGVTDHWGLTPNCKELKALRKFLKRNSNVKIILEIINKDDVRESLALIEDVVREVNYAVNTGN